jgi:hypothetical protein
VDHYALGPPFRDTPGSRGTRKATERALAGRYQPKSPEELAEKKAERQAAGD